MGGWACVCVWGGGGREGGGVSLALPAFLLSVFYFLIFTRNQRGGGPAPQTPTLDPPVHRNQKLCG